MVWGTQEELLLACAVDRHGTRRWDSVAAELRRRSSALTSLTPLTCQKKFGDLRRRFSKSCHPDEATALASLVERLRKIRVDELRREVQRRDSLILSLELKVKRLEEERESSVKREEATDLEDRKAEESPGNDAGEESYASENRSFNESNSTSKKGGYRKRSDVAKEEREIVKSEPSEPGLNPRTGNQPDRDWSINDHSDGVDDDDNNVKKIGAISREEETETETGQEPSQANGLGESEEEVVMEPEAMGESKRENAAAAASKQSSDVQSSASLSTKSKKKLRRAGGGAVAGESSGREEETDEVSPATLRITITKHTVEAKCEPLVRVLGIIRSHRLGSVFERRLRNQGSETYKNLIRQHVDLHTVESRIRRGIYSDCANKFFRDLLLLFNNCIIFFARSTPEHAAALELRALVGKEMKEHKLRQPVVTSESKPEQQIESASKPKEAAAMVVCKRRSSVKRKGDKEEWKVEQNQKPQKDHVVDRKEDCFAGVEENSSVRKKRSRIANKERSNASGRRNSRTGSKGEGGLEHEYGGNELSSHDSLEVPKTVDQMKEISNTVKKKQGAANFLRRMKQNLTTSSEEEASSSDDTDHSKSGPKRRGAWDEEKKRTVARGRRGGGTMKERVTRSSGGRGVREKSGKVKRGVGRPPKRLAAAEPSRARTGKGRRKETEEVVSGRPRKRTRR